MDPKLLLAPIDAEREAIRQLTGYTTASELGDALRRISAAVDTVLRMMLREERSVPDAVRLSALSDLQSPQEVVVSLRRADTITMKLAAGVEQLRGAAERAEAGRVTAADADVAQDVLHGLMDAIMGVGTPTPAVAVPAISSVTGTKVSHRRRLRTWLLGAVVMVSGGLFAWMSLRDTVPAGQAGAEAFAAGRLAEAESLFRLRVADGRGRVADWLYLGRIYRRTDRPEEAAAALRTAVDADPGDPDVRRELGWLFLDLDRPSAAREQFAMALETDPDDPLNWVGLIRALRAAGDPSAGDWLARAPQEARDRLMEPERPARQ